VAKRKGKERGEAGRELIASPIYFSRRKKEVELRGQSLGAIDGRLCDGHRGGEGGKRKRGRERSNLPRSAREVSAGAGRKGWQKIDVPGGTLGRGKREGGPRLGAKRGRERRSPSLHKALRTFVQKRDVQGRHNTVPSFFKTRRGEREREAKKKESASLNHLAER